MINLKEIEVRSIRDDELPELWWYEFKVPTEKEDGFVIANVGVSPIKDTYMLEIAGELLHESIEAIHATVGLILLRLKETRGWWI